MKRLIMFVLVLLTFINMALATEPGHIKLLAVSSDGENETGSVADLYLEIKPGTGRVFIDTYPLTKLDTQFSTRFAKSVACDYLDEDCSEYDFFYTINSRSSIVGGPSAGAAITILTISLLSEEEIPYDAAVTGTINSGGIIGPVGGIKPKVEAAQREGLRMAIIPHLSIGNNSELEEFLNSTEIEVVAAASIDEALYILTGRKMPEAPKIVVDPAFTSTMKEIASTLCSETEGLLVNETNTTEEQRGRNLYELGLNATEDRTYYSAASYCFGANVHLRKLQLKNKTNKELFEISTKLEKDIKRLDGIIDSIELKTLGDLQTYMIVKERIIEANEYWGDEGNISSDDLAYSIERYYSALSWSKFFGTGKKEYVINKDVLKDVCLEKISEVEGFRQYVALYVPIPLVNIQKELEYATEDYARGDYELCIFKASKAKAESLLILEALSINREQMQWLLDQKIELAKKTMASVQDRGVFPILGYSYFEYADSLRESDPDSSLLYIGYANELSNLNVYFEQEKSFEIDIDTELLKIFIWGFLAGIIITLALFLIILKKK